MLLVVIGTVVVVLLLIFGFSLMVLSGRMSEQEREWYYREHGRWPEW